jgi:hypothetical protein
MSQRKEPTTRRYPYDHWGNTPGYDEALETFKDSNKRGEPHIPTFAQLILKKLAAVGPLHTKEDGAPSNIRKVNLGGKQELWVRFDTRRDDEGYMAIDVVAPPRSDAAILAAMVAWLVAEPIDLKKVLWASSIKYSPEMRARLDRAEALQERISAKERNVSFEEYAEQLEFLLAYMSLLEAQRPLEYLMPLIEHYRPEVKDYSPKEQLALYEKACHYINDFLEALRRLQAFLEYGSPNKKLSPPIKEPNRDVKAAVLHDVDGLSYRQIGEKMEIPAPPDLEIKGEHQTVRKMVERGRNILERAFGEDGWQERVATMKAEKEWWKSLSRKEQEKEYEATWLASDLGISVEEARRKL